MKNVEAVFQWPSELGQCCVYWWFMMTSSNGNIFRVTGPLCGEFTGNRWIPHTKGQWGRAFMFSLICAWINGQVKNHEAGDLKRRRAHYDVIVMVDNEMSHFRGCHGEVFYIFFYQIMVKLNCMYIYIYIYIYICVCVSYALHGMTACLNILFTFLENL